MVIGHQCSAEFAVRRRTSIFQSYFILFHCNTLKRLNKQNYWAVGLKRYYCMASGHTPWTSLHTGCLYAVCYDHVYIIYSTGLFHHIEVIDVKIKTVPSQSTPQKNGCKNPCHDSRLPLCFDHATTGLACHNLHFKGFRSLSHLFFVPRLWIFISRWPTGLSHSAWKFIKGYERCWDSDCRCWLSAGLWPYILVCGVVAVPEPTVPT